jgi:acyl transferase domain-containing protein/NADPH:quinone reductase-like Zn-dependent oxidoreductase/acyl carrier protein
MNRLIDHSIAPETGNLIVCSGYSLRAPESDTVREFAEHLEGKHDMTTPTRRYPEGYRNLPPRTGTLREIDRFDKDFFRFNPKQVDKMDIGIRLMLEVTQEALMDAHISIPALRGSNTGVYVGHCFSDYLGQVSRDKDLSGYELVNGAHTMAANKISYHYDLKGPSMVFDTACSSSLVALDAAVKDIRNGTVDRAIVGGISVTLDPAKNATFNAFTMLSPTGCCYSFDERANGYCRSEGIACVILERTEDAMVPGVCAILGTSVNSDGFKEKGITFPSGTQQFVNATKAFSIAGVSPDTIGYIEAHGTGTVAGDSQELGGFDRLFHRGSVPERTIPIGSVKSNMGHAEGASGLMSMIKCLTMYENRRLYPNANFVSSQHAQILDKKFSVVEEAVDWEPSNVCISNYGFGGTNAFAVLGPVAGHPVAGHPVAGSVAPNALEVAESSETSESIESTVPPTRFANTTTSTTDAEWTDRQIALGNDTAFKYKNGVRQTDQYSHITFLYGGQGSQWNDMGRQLYGTVDIFTRTIDRLSKYIHSIDSTCDIAALYRDGSRWMEKENSVLGITSYQIAVTNMYESEGIFPDRFLGHSLGESAAAYACYHRDADGTCHRLQTEEQTIHLAHIRSKLSSEIRTDSSILSTPNRYAAGGIYDAVYPETPDLSAHHTHHTHHNFYYIKATDLSKHPIVDGETLFDLDGMMCAVGLDVATIDRHIESANLCETVVACRNSPTGQTVSGTKREMVILEKSLRSEFPELFWRHIPTDNVAYHAPHLRCHTNAICAKLAGVFGDMEPTPLPDAWVGTCGSRMFDHTYHATNITNPVYFQEAIESLPANTLVLEIGSSSSLIGQVKRIRRDIGCFGIVRVGKPDTELMLKESLRTILWENGYSVPETPSKFSHRLPISRRYPNLWNHDESHRTISYDEFESAGDATVVPRVIYDIAGKDAYLMDHHINGRSLFPATGHLATAWEVLGTDTAYRMTSFEILQAVVLDPESEPEIAFNVLVSENTISIAYDGECVAKMCFKKMGDIESRSAQTSVSATPSDPLQTIKSNDIYNEFARYGYEYRTEFRLLQQRHLDPTHITKSTGTLRSTEHLIAYLDCTLQMFLEDIDALSLPTLIRTVELSPCLFETIKSESRVVADTRSKTVVGVGVSFGELHTTLAAPPSRHPLRHNHQTFVAWGSEVENFDQVVAEIVGMEMLGRFIDVGELMVANESVAVDPVAVDPVAVDPVAVDPVAVDPPKSIEPAMSKLLNNMNDLVQSWATAVPADDAQRTFDLMFCDSVDTAIAHTALGGFVCISSDGPSVTTLSNHCIHLCSGKMMDRDWSLWRRTTDIPVTNTIVSKWNDVTPNSETNSQLYVDRGAYGFLKSVIKETGDRTISACDNAIPLTADEVAKVTRYGMFGMRFHSFDTEVPVVLSYKRRIGTRVHIARTPPPSIPAAAVQLHIDKPGDLDTLMWKEMRPTDTKVSYASLNFKDIMYSFGKLRLKKPSFGLEFSGIDGTGRRVMGITATSSIATHVDPAITWEIPNQMSLADAATIPVVYCTSLYALFEKAHLESGQTVLIHAGTGGIGHAAIQCCQRRGIEVFTTCSAKKRTYLHETFGVPEDHIFDSRSSSFRDDILRATQGRGVDCVLNSLDGALMEQSIECVAEFGNFCEIGKYDLLNNSKIGIKLFERNISYHGIDLADMFVEPRRAKKLFELLNSAIDEGIVRALPHEIFEAEDHEKALRFMSGGKHKGKVLIRMEDYVPASTKPQFFTSGTHILTGGCGGFGMELALWLLSRGAEKVVLTSRRGLTEGRQTWKMRNLERMGNIEISTDDVCDIQTCNDLISRHSSDLKGMWHLATVLEDTVLANMTADKWDALYRIKVTAMENIDRLTRNMTLDAFVTFSSISSMIGNVGQSNYSSANNVSEQIVLARNRAGVGGIAIQWGAIDNVGVMMKGEDNLKNGFTNSICEFQNIDHSIDSLNRLLRYDGVVSSYEEKRPDIDESEDMEMTVERIQNQFAKILGGTAEQYETTIVLSNFGLDSLSTVELVNWVNRAVRVKINAAFLNEGMTIARLFEYIEANRV